TEARQIVGDRLLVGRSVHDINGARRAEDDAADYALAGHVFDTESKAGEPGRGLEWLARLCAAVEIPVIALGGITVGRIPLVIRAGAHGVAIGRELLQAADPEEVARAVMSAMRERTTSHT
ncbi:MAG: thiamine phosphate synthase, partial [Vicinamibacterales bacterium]